MHTCNYSGLKAYNQVKVPGSWTRHTCNYSGLKAYNQCLTSKRAAQNFQNLGPNTLAILEAYNQCLIQKWLDQNFQDLRSNTLANILTSKCTINV